MQDRVEIFGSRVGFSWTAYLTVSFNPPDDPCGNEIWDKIGYYSPNIRDIPEMFASNKGFSGSGY